MIESRKQFLLTNKILSTRLGNTIINPYISKYISNFDISIFESYNGESLKEKIWRYLHDDNTDKKCKKCDKNVSFGQNLNSGFHQYCSQNCARPILVGNKNGFFGKKHTKETKNKMSDNHADFTGEKNPYKKALLKNPEKRKDASDRLKKIWKNRTDDELLKICNNMSIGQAKNRHTGFAKGYKTKHVTSTKLKNKAFLRSSWEIKLFEKINMIDEIISIEVESLFIPYKDGMKVRHAISDFLIELKNGQKILIEVKPQPICEIKKNILYSQYNYCKIHNYKFIIMDLDIIENYIEKAIQLSINGEFDNIEILDVNNFKNIIKK